jgi:hypothetical protein
VVGAGGGRVDEMAARVAHGDSLRWRWLRSVGKR